MNEEFIEKKILITVKTYPNPSHKYTETVCTAGITDQGKWIRLYPIKFRQLENDQQYKLFSWVKAEVKRNHSDIRPESYKVNHETINIIQILDPKKDIEERRKWILPLKKPSLETIWDDYSKNNVSLAAFTPYIIDDLIIEETTKDWNTDELARLNQINFFDNDKQVKLLEKVPYDFKLKFRCHGSQCNGHTMKITNWEIYQTYRSYLLRYGSERDALKKLKDKWLSFFSDDKECCLFVGTVYPKPSFIIIGHFSYPKQYIKQISGQVNLFDFL